MFLEILKFLIYSMLIVLISKYILVRVLRKLGELLELKPKVIGNIAGIATSIPELLTVSFSALAGLIETSAYNIISSNVINLVQYSISVTLNKNKNAVKNKAIKIDLSLVIITIIIPILMMIFGIEDSLTLVPIFIILMILFYRITSNCHKLYIKEKKVEEEKKSSIKIKDKAKKHTRVALYGVILILVGVALFLIGNLLSDVLENLCLTFNVPEFVIGILLGFITSLPELITFFESQRHHSSEQEGIVEATSNLLTSNIMNLFVIQSLGIIIYSVVASG